jgi:hypothetical protein
MEENALNGEPAKSVDRYVNYMRKRLVESNVDWTTNGSNTLAFGTFDGLADAISQVYATRVGNELDTGQLRYQFMTKAQSKETAMVDMTLSVKKQAINVIKMADLENVDTAEDDEDLKILRDQKRAIDMHSTVFPSRPVVELEMVEREQTSRRNRMQYACREIIRDTARDAQQMLLAHFFDARTRAVGSDRRIRAGSDYFPGTVFNMKLPSTMPNASGADEKEEEEEVVAPQPSRRRVRRPPSPPSSASLFALQSLVTMRLGGKREKGAKNIRVMKKEKPKKKKKESPVPSPSDLSDDDDDKNVEDPLIPPSSSSSSSSSSDEDEKLPPERQQPTTGTPAPQIGPSSRPHTGTRTPMTHEEYRSRFKSHKVEYDPSTWTQVVQNAADEFTSLTNSNGDTAITDMNRSMLRRLFALDGYTSDTTFPKLDWSLFLINHKNTYVPEGGPRWRLDWPKDPNNGNKFVSDIHDRTGWMLVDYYPEDKTQDVIQYPFRYYRLGAIAGSQAMFFKFAFLMYGIVQQSLENATWKGFFNANAQSDNEGLPLLRKLAARRTETVRNLSIKDFIDAELAAVWNLCLGRIPLYLNTNNSDENDFHYAMGTTFDMTTFTELTKASAAYEPDWHMGLENVAYLGAFKIKKRETPVAPDAQRFANRWRCASGMKQSLGTLIKTIVGDRNSRFACGKEFLWNFGRHLTLSVLVGMDFFQRLTVPLIGPWLSPWLDRFYRFKAAFPVFRLFARALSNASKKANWAATLRDGLTTPDLVQGFDPVRHFAGTNLDRDWRLDTFSYAPFLNPTHDMTSDQRAAVQRSHYGIMPSNPVMMEQFSKFEGVFQDLASRPVEYGALPGSYSISGYPIETAEGKATVYAVASIAKIIARGWDDLADQAKDAVGAKVSDPQFLLDVEPYMKAILFKDPRWPFGSKDAAGWSEIVERHFKATSLSDLDRATLADKLKGEQNAFSRDAANLLQRTLDGARIAFKTTEMHPDVIRPYSALLTRLMIGKPSLIDFIQAADKFIAPSVSTTVLGDYPVTHMGNAMDVPGHSVAYQNATRTLYPAPLTGNNEQQYQFNATGIAESTKLDFITYTGDEYNTTETTELNAMNIFLYFNRSYDGTKPIIAPHGNQTFISGEPPTTTATTTESGAKAFIPVPSETQTEVQRLEDLVSIWRASYSISETSASIVQGLRNPSRVLLSALGGFHTRADQTANGVGLRWILLPLLDRRPRSGAYTDVDVFGKPRVRKDETTGKTISIEDPFTQIGRRLFNILPDESSVNPLFRNIRPYIMARYRQNSDMDIQFSGASALASLRHVRYALDFLRFTSGVLKGWGFFIEGVSPFVNSIAVGWDKGTANVELDFALIDAQGFLFDQVRWMNGLNRDAIHTASYRQLGMDWSTVILFWALIAAARTLSDGLERDTGARTKDLRLNLKTAYEAEANKLLKFSDISGYISAISRAIDGSANIKFNEGRSYRMFVVVKSSSAVLNSVKRFVIRFFRPQLPLFPAIVYYMYEFIEFALWFFGYWDPLVQWIGPAFEAIEKWYQASWLPVEAYVMGAIVIVYVLIRRSYAFKSTRRLLSGFARFMMWPVLSYGIWTLSANFLSRRAAKALIIASTDTAFQDWLFSSMGALLDSWVEANPVESDLGVEEPSGIADNIRTAPTTQTLPTLKTMFDDHNVTDNTSSPSPPFLYPYTSKMDDDADVRALALVSTEDASLRSFYVGFHRLMKRRGGGGSRELSKSRTDAILLSLRLFSLVKL